MNISRLNLNQAVTHRLAQALYACMEDVGSTKGALYLLDSDDNHMHLVADYGWPRTLPPPAVLSLEDPFVVWVHRERRTFVVNESLKFPELQVLNPGAEPSRFLVTPIYDRGDWAGILIQRDRIRNGSYDLDRDAKPSAAICESIVSILREFTSFLTPEPAPAPGVDMDWIPGSLAGPSEGGEANAGWNAVPPMPVQVPPSEAMVPTLNPPSREALEGFRDSNGSSAFAAMPATQGHSPLGVDDSRELPPEPGGGAPEDEAEPEVTGGGSPRKPRTGMFLPEQRTFFWEAASLLSDLTSVDAVALWMSEPDEVRPILTYSRYPLSGDLKQQVMAHVTFHLQQMTQKELRILSRAEWMEQDPLQGVFQTYLPVVLMEEGSGKDMLLLFRLRPEAFTEAEVLHIQQVGRMLGYHLQEGRLHERYHRAFLSVSHRLLRSAEARTPDLRPHSLATAKLARKLALHLDLPSPEVEAISIAAILHDVGTLLLDPSLLSKGALTAEDMAKFRTHPLLAAAFLRDFRFPYDVLTIIRHHHERYDGRGYPEGLQGDEIPIGSRIIALIESYEVMSSGKGYKEPRPMRTILEELQREAGGQFDPLLVAEFIPMISRLREE